MKVKRAKSKLGPPTLIEEKSLFSEGYRLIAGLDEAGRGSLAGPVVASAVVLPLDRDLNSLKEVRDSKELSASKRESLFSLIQHSALTIGVGIISSTIIDSSGILNATRMAMRIAVEQLCAAPDYLLVDGAPIVKLSTIQKGIIKGDKTCLSIACASVIAKVTRDRIMVELDESYPDYGLATHKGYGTQYHLSRLQIKGPSPIHRYSFAPVKETLRLI